MTYFDTRMSSQNSERLAYRLFLPGTGAQVRKRNFWLARHRHVEEPTLVLKRALVAGLAHYPIARDDVPDVVSPHPRSREPVAQQGRHKHDRPLHPLGLVDGHHPDSVGVRILIVLPALGIGAVGAVLQEFGELVVLPDGVRVVVDALESPR